MKKNKTIKTICLLAFFAGSLAINAQTKFKVPEYLDRELSDTENQIMASLEKLFVSIDNGEIDTTLINKTDFDFNLNFFKYFEGIESNDTITNYFQGQLLNLYPITPSSYSITIAYVHNNEIGRIFTFIANNNDGNVVFANPIKYNTRHWKTKTVGSITYYYPDTINIQQAENFDRKNKMMASKLNLPVMELEMYMCNNYQEALQFQGCIYEFSYNGLVNSGDIVSPKTLFSVMNNEDFSHDVLHMYANKIRGKIMNHAAEEGIAYNWGNAYYTNDNGKIPEQQELVLLLRQYIQTHAEAKLLDLFNKNPNVLAEYGSPKPISVKAVISGVICEEVEKQKGVAGIIELMKCGKGDENYFKCIDTLLQINKNNFDEKVYKLLFQ
jgi:hypothetical protein